MFDRTSKWNARDYAQNSTAQLKWAQELIDKLELQGNEYLLDLGCGDGKITASLARQLSQGIVVGIDRSPEMIALAAEQFPQTSYPNLKFEQMDAIALELPQQFDLVFSNAVLHWIEDHLSVLNGVRDCLKPGGKILWQMGGKGNVAELIEVIETVINSSSWRNYFTDFLFPYSFYGREEYEQWLPQTGFDPVRIDLIPKDMQHRGRKGLAGWLRTTWFPLLDRVPPNLQQRLLDCILDEYLQEYAIDSQGYTHVKMVRLEVEAIKQR